MKPAMFDIRYSHRRLTIAMVLSSVIVAALLGMFALILGDSDCDEIWCFDEADVLTVHIEQKVAESNSEMVPPDDEIRTVPPAESNTDDPQPAEAEKEEVVADHDYVADPPNDEMPARDWYAIAKEPIGQTIDEYFENEEIRKRMWRRTGSVMFEDTGEFDFQEPPTIIAAREFRVPVGVLGIGVTVGGCFFGIPLAGIPVEARGAGPNVIYCTDIYE